LSQQCSWQYAVNSFFTPVLQIQMHAVLMHCSDSSVFCCSGHGPSAKCSCWPYDPTFEWRERMFQEFDGTIKNSFGYPV